MKPHKFWKSYTAKKGTPMKLRTFWKTDTRNNGETFSTLTDNVPDWFRAACYKAHQGTMPNDWIYETCRAVCCAIDDGALTDDTDSVHEFSDAMVDIYTKELYRWAADMCLTDIYSLAESEAHEVGTEDLCVDKQLAAIQYYAITAITETILDAYPSRTEF